jgi:hypothetical protein
MPNRWIEHVKQFAADNKVSFGCALSDPNMKNTYKKDEKTQIKATETNKKLTLKENGENTFKKILSNRLRENMNLTIGDTFTSYVGAYEYMYIITRQTEKTIFYKQCKIFKSEKYFKGAPDAIHDKTDYDNYISYLPVPDPEAKEQKMAKNKFDVKNYIDIKNKVFKNFKEVNGLNPNTCDELNNREIMEKEYNIQSKLNYFKINEEKIKNIEVQKKVIIKKELFKKELNELYKSSENEFIRLLKKIDIRDGMIFINGKWKNVYYNNLFFEIVKN